ncbi:MAG: hypothetical protein M0C28_15760 [Candidatus Moduliflexus flocculans]|nr:hypothetical protein [Candidatus Moduliflexus flocculans]
MTVDMEGFNEAFDKHRELSRKGAEQKFKGGLADHSDLVRSFTQPPTYFTLPSGRSSGEHVAQKGSNITDQRLRFDFSHPDPMTPEQIRVRSKSCVNRAIRAGLEVTVREMTPEGCTGGWRPGLFKDRYGGEGQGLLHPGLLRETCGGPHVGNTAELVGFRILSEEELVPGDPPDKGGP